MRLWSPTKSLWILPRISARSSPPYKLKTLTLNILITSTLSFKESVHNKYHAIIQGKEVNIHTLETMTWDERSDLCSYLLEAQVQVLIQGSGFSYDWLVARLESNLLSKGITPVGDSSYRTYTLGYGFSITLAGSNQVSEPGRFSLAIICTNELTYELMATQHDLEDKCMLLMRT